jgi:antibiotic biosynthesis monooxygenase (ABM) superfamily enzyme
MLISTGITVALLTYWLMPLLTRCFKGWLFKA